jgi:exosortase A-associated hydrolase 1
MGEAMRRILSFDCQDSTLAATLDEGDATTGLLIVSGGNEIRMGAHRGMATLSQALNHLDYPAFRFDRRGIGDSEGENGGFLTSAPDIEAAVAAFKHHCPKLTRIVAFGNCDAASALLLRAVPGIDALVLANIWIVEPTDDLPPPAAIRARYVERLGDPKAWFGLFTGAINLRKLAGGLFKIARKQPPRLNSLSRQVAAGLVQFPGPVTILLAERDGTALAFSDAWQKPDYAEVRERSTIRLIKIDSASHSFAGSVDTALLFDTIVGAL